MEKRERTTQILKAGNMLYPVPVVMVTIADKEGKSNIITVAWTGTVCSDPAMVYISLRPERYSYHLLEEAGEFVINLTTKNLTKAMDFCGVKSGKDTDKWKETGLTQMPATKVHAPIIAESPVNIECRVQKVIPLGSHHMFLATVEAVDVDERYMDENGKFDLNSTGLIAYSHGSYQCLGELVGSFGYSVKKAGKDKRK